MLLNLKTTQSSFLKFFGLLSVSLLLIIVAIFNVDSDPTVDGVTVRALVDAASPKSRPILTITPDSSSSEASSLLVSLSRNLALIIFYLMLSMINVISKHLKKHF